MLKAGAGGVDAGRTAAVARPTNSWLVFARRRAVSLLVSLVALLTFSFLMIHLMPGDPVRNALGVHTPQATVDAKRAALGLDDALPVQYWRFITDVFRGNLGESLQLQTPVAEIIATRLPDTLQLVGLAFAVILIVAIPGGLALGVLTRGGRHRGSELSFTSTAVALAAIPDFLLSVVLIAVFAVGLKWVGIAGNDGWTSYVIPVVALAAGPAATLTRIARVEVLGVLDADYIRTARAKRLKPWRVYVRHALPNALTATLTVGGLTLVTLIAGTVLVEQTLAWPGLGPVLVQSILSKDFPLVQGIVLVYGVLVLLVNLCVDVLLALLDPRSTIRER